MSNAPFLTLVSELLPVQRRDFYLADSTLLDPNNANPVVDGEWLELDSNYKLARGSSTQVKPAWQLFAERGRYDTQAIGKAPVLFIGGYEAETSICDLTALSVGDPLMVADVTVSALTKRGLKKATASTGANILVFGWVTRLPGGGKVRYWKTMDSFQA